MNSEMQEGPRFTWRHWLMLMTAIACLALGGVVVHLAWSVLSWLGPAFGYAIGGVVLLSIGSSPFIAFWWLAGEKENRSIKARKFAPNANNTYAALLSKNQKKFIQPVNGELPQAVPGHYAPAIHNHNDVRELVKLMEMARVSITEENPLELEGPRFPEPCDFTRVLEEGFRPSRNSIYLLDTVNGSIAKDVYGLTHIGLGGPTGGGKTTTNRMITSQLLSPEVGAYVYLASPNFAPVKLNGNRIEDWRPIMRLLTEPPAQEADEIRSLLRRFIKLFEQRKRDEWKSLHRGQDVFLVLGEWPGIVARVPEASDIFKLLLRESRQYGIHLITEMQDALVKTIGIDSGCRDNLRTGYYYGGDDTTAKVLLNLAKGETINETGLGQNGAAYLRTLTDKALPGRVPFFSNRALYMLLGSPPDPMPDGPVSSRDIPSSYYQVVDGNYVESSARVITEDTPAAPELPCDVGDDEPETELPMDENLREALDAYNNGAIGPRAMERALKCSYYQAQKKWNELVDRGLVKN